MVHTLTKHLPWLEWVPNYNINRDLKFDVIAGITVAMMIVPQEISLANVMSVPAQYGLYTAALTPILYTVFGTSRVLSVANGSEVSLMVGTYLQTISDLKERVAVGILLSFIIGVINFTLGCLHLGVVADFLSRPVMGGFLSAGGILIMVAQFPTWVQVTLPTYSYPLQTIYEIINHFHQINWNSFLVGLVSIFVLSLFKYAKGRFSDVPKLSELLDEPAPVTSREQWGFSLNENDYASMEETIARDRETKPKAFDKSKGLILFVLRTFCDLGPLVICLFGILAGYLIGEKRIKVTGHVPHGMPDPLVPWYGYNDHLIKNVTFTDILIQAASMAIVVYSTSVAIAKRLAVRGNYDINTNQELLALGFASAVGSFFQIMPPTGGMSRTAVNVQSAKTQLASFITVSLVIIVLCCLTNALYYLPKASLASIVIVAGYWLIEFEEAKWLFKAKRDEFYVWIFSFILTVAFGILPGLFGSIGCSVLALMIKTKKPGVALLGLNEAGQFVDASSNLNVAIPNDVLVVRVEGSLYFGNSEYLSKYLLNQVLEFPGRSFIVLDMKYLHDIDATTIQVFEILEERLSHYNVQLAFANARKVVAGVLNASGLIKTKPPPDKNLEHVLEFVRHNE
ncbi:Sulfate Permease (SulP) Family [Thraustotheca clavata]|uniref:Sulfate Permease (SulP) Family n=1 Tax=Thraustotheca clavata TaxID=74557 RepID=A0A1V9ZEX8_9STRA|nr:Sulfate Permease (SulP) Family [Thraustotheca clavata]